MPTVYYKYRIPDTRPIFIGTEREQIYDTLDHYRNKHPSDPHLVEKYQRPHQWNISVLEKLALKCKDPHERSRHFSTAEIREGVMLKFDTRGWHFLREIAHEYEHLKRGSLYKLQVCEGAQLYLLPQSFMEGIRGYNWLKHQRQMEVTV